MIEILAAAAIAASAESWTCTYPGFGANREPVILTYTRDGGSLVESDFEVPHRILEDTPTGIVAVSSMALTERGRSDPSIGGYMIAIDKKSGAYVRSATFIGTEAGTGFARGRCIRAR
jgi:hypothetical protein